ALVAEWSHRQLLAVAVVDEDQVVGPETAVPHDLVSARDILHDVLHGDGLADLELLPGKSDLRPQALDLRPELVLARRQCPRNCSGPSRAGRRGFGSAVSVLGRVTAPRPLPPRGPAGRGRG